MALVIKMGMRNWWDSGNGMAITTAIANTRPIDRSSYWESCQQQSRTHSKIPTGTIPLGSTLRVEITPMPSMWSSSSPGGTLLQDRQYQQDWLKRPTILLQRRTKGSHIRPIKRLLDVEEVSGILMRHQQVGLVYLDETDDGNVDKDLSSNGQSLYRPTPGQPYSIFPHSPDHQSASIKDLSDDPHQVLSNTNDRPTGPDQSPVVVFHLHQTYCLYFDLSHTPY